MKELFANADAGLYGLVIFFVFFIAAVAWLFRPGASKKYKSYGEIPLKEDGRNDEK